MLFWIICQATEGCFRAVGFDPFIKQAFEEEKPPLPEL